MNKTELVHAVESLIKERSAGSEEKWVYDNLLFLHVAGSRLYGTNSETSDWDIRGVTLAPRSYWIGAREFEQAQIQTDEFDIVLYDFRKWLKLTAQVNPNVVETLYANDDAVLYASELWPLVKQRTLPMISQRAHIGFHGYASSQLKKMVVKQSNKTGRREIADEFSFDTKFAMHGFRIARQGVELLSTGKITFPRPDANELKDIRNGKVYTDADTCISAWEKESQKLDEALTTSVLPLWPDFEPYNQLLMDMFEHCRHG